MGRMRPAFEGNMDLVSWNNGRYDFDVNVENGREVWTAAHRPTYAESLNVGPGDYMHPAHEASNQVANANLCGKTTLSMAIASGIAAGRIGASAGAAACSSSLLAGPAGYPGCVAAYTAGGASMGIVAGMVAAMNVASCQNSTFNHPTPVEPIVCNKPPQKASRPGHQEKARGNNSSDNFGLGKCPTHGVEHSCPDNPTPTRPSFRGGRGNGDGACAPSCAGGGGGSGGGSGGACGGSGGGSGGACGGGCGCGC